MSDPRWHHARNRHGQHFYSALIRGVACSVVSREGIFFDAAIKRPGARSWRRVGTWMFADSAKKACVMKVRGRP